MPSQMSSQPTQKRKRPIEDFFRPFGQTNTTIPQKRPSPSGADGEQVVAVRKPAPKTPAKTVKFKDATPNSIRSLYFTPTSQSSLPIRSPKPQLSPSPSKGRKSTLLDYIQKSPVKEAKPNASFTFSDVSERGQKVVEHGKVIAIRDSDDDIDSLESLEDIFGRRNDITTTSESSPPEDVEAERVKTLSMFTSGRSVPIVGKDKLRALYAKEKSVKFDLSTVLDDHFGDEEAQQNISRMRAGFDVKEYDSDDQIDRNLLASLVRTEDADREDVERLLHAVERTEALSDEKKFSFFVRDSIAKTKSLRRDPFPRSAIPGGLWSHKNLDAQDRAYLSGYMAELGLSSGLDDEALKWTFNQVTYESRDDIRQAYVECLEASSKSWTRVNVSAADVQSLFQNLGADMACLRDASSIKPKHYTVEEDLQPDHTYLLSTLQMFQIICPDMDFAALSKLTSIALRLALDSSVMSHSRVCTAVECLIETMLSLPEEETRSHIYERLLSDATDHLHDPQLQVQLLSHILPTTLGAIDLRKTLADIFLLGPTTLERSTNRSNATIDKLTEYVKSSPAFSITRHAHTAAVNYSHLTSLTHILNIAVSSANSPPSSHSRNLVVSNTLMPAATKVKSNAVEIGYNTTIDHLADTLHTLFISIKDTGASHMRRTEAKDALQALYFRLLFSIRTKVRKKRHVFDANGGIKGATGAKGRWITGEEFREKERGGEFIKRFLAKKIGQGQGIGMEVDV